jgi:hypothetical protein
VDTPDADAPKAPVDDAVWAAMKDKRVAIERRDGTTATGKLIASEGTHAVLMGDDNTVVSIPKDDAVGLKVEEPAAEPALPTEPPPEEEAEDEKPPEAWPYKKLGVFTSHGVAYSRWRASTMRDGAATYVLDAAIGYNFSHRFGVYGLFGGAVGAKLLDGNVRGNYGHFALSFLVRRKYVAFIPGLGLALASRRDSDGLVRETGFALPVKLMGVIPLPKDLFLGIGLTYDLAIMADTRLFQTIGAQVTFGRW